MPAKTLVRPVLSVIVLSFNTKEITLDCLRSLEKYLPATAEVVVLDNASSDGSYEALAQFVRGRKAFHLFRSEKNLGFGGGNNLAVSKSKGEFVLFLNSDTLLIEDCLTPCLIYLQSHSELGAISCRLLNADRSIQYTGGYFPTLARVFTWQFFLDDLPFLSDLLPSVHPHHQGFNFLQKFFTGFGLYTEKGRAAAGEIRSSEWLTGAFLMMGRTVFEAAGGFDPGVFMYAEELEFCYRIAKLGRKLALLPTPSIIHLGGASSGSVLAISAEVKGLVYFFKKHKPAWQLPIVKSFFWGGALLRYLIFGIIRNNETARLAYAQTLRELT